MAEVGTDGVAGVSEQVQPGSLISAGIGPIGRAIARHLTIVRMELSPLLAL